MMESYGVGGSIPPAAPPLLTCRGLAHLVDQHVAALWRGDESVDHEFFRWLDSWWGPCAAPEPTSPPDALSVLGAGGVGIRWYDSAIGFIGHVSGRPGGCYRVPLTATPPQPEQMAAPVPRGLRAPARA